MDLSPSPKSEVAHAVGVVFRWLVEWCDDEAARSCLYFVLLLESESGSYDLRRLIGVACCMFGHTVVARDCRPRSLHSYSFHQDTKLKLNSELFKDSKKHAIH